MDRLFPECSPSEGKRYGGVACTAGHHPPIAGHPRNEIYTHIEVRALVHLALLVGLALAVSHVVHVSPE